MSIAFEQRKGTLPVGMKGVSEEQGTGVRRPLVWLALIVLLGFGLRYWYLHAEFEQDEFGPVYAVVERVVPEGFLPSVQDALTPVKSLATVGERSVLPFGIVNPVPLHNYLLYAMVQVLPVSEATLRLPSLLASVGCIIGMYLLCRRLLGAEVALVAAALTAVDPQQISAAQLVRPYALANFACVLSFLSLLHLLDSQRTLGRVVSMLGYALSVMLIGYLNPILLLVVAAHVALVVYQFVIEPNRGLTAGAWWLAGAVLAGLLLVPEIPYILQVNAFHVANKQYLSQLESTRLLNVLYHNSTFLAALLVATGGGFAIRELLLSNGAATEEEETAKENGSASAAPKLAAPPVEEGEPLPENPLMVWTGRLWFFLPQIVGLAMAMAGLNFLFVSRYLCYTSLGGVILLAYWATRDRNRDVRLGVSVVTVLTVLLWGSFMSVGKGFGLHTPKVGNLVTTQLDELESEGRWKEGDVVLYRAGFIEGDFVTDQVPQASRAAVAGVCLAPMTTLYVPQTRKPIVLLSYSQNRDGRLGTATREIYKPETFYTPELAERVRGFERFWICTQGRFERPQFLAGLLPWLADAVGWDLKVARKRPEQDRYFDVYTDIEGDHFVSGLSDAKVTDFTPLVLARRKTPRGIFQLGALTAAPLPGGYLTLPIWLATQDRTPRPTLPLDAELELEQLDEHNR